MGNRRCAGGHQAAAAMGSLAGWLRWRRGVGIIQQRRARVAIKKRNNAVGLAMAPAAVEGRPAQSARLRCGRSRAGSGGGGSWGASGNDGGAGRGTGPAAAVGCGWRGARADQVVDSHLGAAGRGLAPAAAEQAAAGQGTRRGRRRRARGASKKRRQCGRVRDGSGGGARANQGEGVRGAGGQRMTGQSRAGSDGGGSSNARRGRSGK